MNQSHKTSAGFETAFSEVISGLDSLFEVIPMATRINGSFEATGCKNHLFALSTSDDLSGGLNAVGG